MPRQPTKAFTLAELLIALAILGVIATFTIPKVLQAQQNNSYKAIAREAAGAVSQAYQVATLNGKINTASSMQDLMPYLNYVSVVTSGLVDHVPGNGTRDCATATCLKLHNGSMLYFYSDYFGGTGTTNATFFFVDPDGKNSPGGEPSSVMLFLYYNGKLRTVGSIDANTQSGATVYNPVPGNDPSWFSWN